MKNLLFIIIAVLFITGFNGNNMEKDAKKLANESRKVFQEINKKYEAGEISSETEDEYFAKTYPKLYALDEKMKEKYKDNYSEFEELYNKYLGDITTNNQNSDNEIFQESEDDMSNEESYNQEKESNEFALKAKEILKSHIFMKVTSLTSMIIFKFDDSQFSFLVMAIGGAQNKGTELCKAGGTYHVLPANDGSIAQITLNVSGPVQKSPYYADESVNTEIFLYNNKILLLKYPSNELISYISPIDALGMGDETPDFYLLGKDCFFANKILSKDEKEQERIESEKKQKLLDDLKAL